MATVAAWAWGAQRVVDYLITREEVDPERIAITGHSRAGKAALFAGALDERIALVAPAGSGAGGAGSYKILGEFLEPSESLGAITDPKRWHYWFHQRLRAFDGYEDRLPFDQHFVKAMVAPRALLCLEGLNDYWANPYGTQQTTVAAQPVFDLLGAGDKNGIFYRQGGHSMSEEDWMALLDYADLKFFGKESSRDFYRLPFASEVDRVFLTPGEHKNVFTAASDDIPKLNYLLSLPKKYSASNDPWPLIVYLHGGGERGDNLDKLKVHGPPKIAGRNKDFPFVVLSPQCPSGSRWTYEIKTVKSLLDNILDNYNVDPGRVYLTGLSLGGYGTWNMAMMYPEYFAAIAPMCGGGIVDEASKLKNIPVWVFHGAKDESNPLANNERMVAAAKRAGCNVKFTVYPELGHDCWTVSYDNPKLYEWFLSHRKPGRWFRAKATASDNSYKAYQALDKDLSTRWDTGKPARPGQWFAVDLGMAVEFEGVVLDTTGSNEDYPRGCEVYVSSDGKRWGEPVAMAGEDQKTITLVKFGKKVKARHVKIVQKGSSGHRFWSIHEFDLYIK